MGSFWIDETLKATVNSEGLVDGVGWALGRQGPASLDVSCPALGLTFLIVKQNGW